MTSSARPPSILQPIKRIIAFLPREDWIVIGWVIAIKTLLFVIGVKSYPMLWTDTHQPQIDGSRYGISGISAITKRLQNLDTRRETARLRFTRCFRASFGWSLTSVEIILLPGLSSLASLRLPRRYCCAGWYNSIMAARSRCAVCGSFLFFRQLTFCTWDIAKVCFWLWHSVLS